MENLTYKRGAVRGQITRFSNYLNGLRDPINYEQLKIRLNKIMGCFDRYDDVQTAIEIETKTVDEEERDAFEEMYFGVITKAEEILSQASSATSSRQANNPPVHDQSQIKLPSITIPTYDGSFDKWNHFYGLFNSLIHEHAVLKPVQKFHYLKAALTGEALHLIDSLEVSEESYETALQLLKDRFSNKKLITLAHIRSLFELQQMPRENYTQLQKFVDTFQKHVSALKASEYSDKDLVDLLLIFILSTKLDKGTLKEWEMHVAEESELSTYDNFLKFLRQRCRILESLQFNSGQTALQNLANSQYSQKAQIKQSKSFHATEQALSSSNEQEVQAESRCQLCKQPHKLFSCSNFLSLSVQDRINEVKRLKLCLNCLMPGHMVAQCSRGVCKICYKKHNSLLHLQGKTDVNRANRKRQTSEIQSSNTASINTQSQNSSTANLVVQDIPVNLSHIGVHNANTQILLTTAVVDVLNYKNEKITCRLILDSGSQSNFISQKLCNKLGFQTVTERLMIKGIGSNVSQVTQSIMLTILSRCIDFHINLKLFVLPKVAENLPMVNVNISQLQVPNNICLADPYFHKSDTVDMLVGAEVYFDILSKGQIRLSTHGPVFQNSKLGWIIGGKVESESSNETTSNLTLCYSTMTNEHISKQIQAFWELEDVTTERKLLKEEHDCEIHFQKHVTQNEHGRFSVSLPFKENISLLADSRETALKRYLSLENRLERDQLLKTQYTEFMKEYRSLGHMKHIHDNGLGYYIPHHPVLKPDSLTTKLRVVFDASARTMSGVSLNDTLMKGPVVQRELFEIITCFRFHNIALSADVEKMYRQVSVHEPDTKYQKIFWRESTRDEIQVFELQTVTYGTTCAPYLATKCLSQSALNFQSQYPSAARSILEDTYVDDLLTGAATVEDALQLHSQLTEILKSGCFRLRKWRSNHQDIFTNFSSHIENYVMPQESLQSSKTLGLVWDSCQDTLKFSISHDANLIHTKRSVLASIAKIFDPLGLLGPIITTAKLVMQQLWQLEQNWDDKLPDKLNTHWVQVQHQLLLLNKMVVPRKVTAFITHSSVQVIGFCDASERAYGACIYIRTTNSDGYHSVHLLCSKGRVAPLKTMSLPRLELCAAVLLSQLIAKLKSCLRVPIDNYFLWSDSTIVLQWLAAPPVTWKTFISNRVAEIQRNTEVNQWHHIKSQDNPADAISRGMMPKEFLQCKLWWQGPDWLVENITNWPISTPQDSTIPDQTLEFRKSLFSCHVQSTNIGDIISRFSSLTKLKRTMTYCFRFIEATRSHILSSTTLTVDEVNHTFDKLIKVVQFEEFSEDIIYLTKHKQLKSSSKLLPLSPFIDSIGILRVGGRLKQAHISFSQKYPILLPTKHKLTELIIDHEHKELLHAGPQAVLASLRNKYWPVSGKVAVKRVLRTCVTCFRHRPKIDHPIMGNLPSVRLTPARPFLHVGLDYAGPITLKESNRRGRPRTFPAYIVVFVCMATKAVHLELVSSLTSEAFITALKRFMSRRGKCASIYSDNASNFTKAHKQLKEIINILTSSNHWTQIEKFATDQAIAWHFIPPRSPTFGGLWEAAVKSMKHHLKRITGNSIFTYEEYQTFLIQIEACLNSRPLTPLSNDPNDFTILTPAHFLIGDSLTTTPDLNYRLVPTNTLTRWNHIQLLLQHLWKRWSSEYLNHLQRRSKWQVQQRNLQPGDMVILKEDNLPPFQWRLARVIEAVRGSDQIVRVVKVKTATGILTRGVHKVCLLPIIDSQP